MGEADVIKILDLLINDRTVTVSIDSPKSVASLRTAIYKARESYNIGFSVMNDVSYDVFEGKSLSCVYSYEHKNCVLKLIPKAGRTTYSILEIS
jgi:sRNA-binding carbon storage regulator CsrA